MEYVPPVDYGAHFRIADAARWVDLRAGHFHVAVPKLYRTHEEVHLKSVRVQPTLVQIDLAVVEHAQAEGPETIGTLREALSDKQAQQPGVKPGGDAAVEWHVAPVSSSAQKPRSDHQVGTLIANRFEQAWDFVRLVLVVASHDDGEVIVVLVTIAHTCSESRTDATHGGET